MIGSHSLRVLMTTIEIAKDFSDVPAGRYRKDGQFSGERFRQEFLVKSLRKSGEKIVVILDGVEGYGSSFLDEAFGGLVRDEQFSSDELHKRLEIIAKSESFKIYVDEIWGYIDDARSRPKPR